MTKEMAGSFLRSDDAPTVEQIEEYRDTMVDIVREMHKGIKVTARFPGTEFMLPGGLTQWSMPDDEDLVRIERDRNYAASYKKLGDRVHKLIVLETESRFLQSDNRYITHRGIYRFVWIGNDVYDAQALHTEVVSDAAVSMLVVPNAIEQVAVGEVDDSCDPFRFTEHELVTETDLEYLLYRTDQYNRAIIAQGRQDYHDDIDDILAG